MAITAQNLVKNLRKDLISQTWQAKKRLPIRESFISRYNTSQTTVQKAMSQLSTEGFIVSHGKKGTYTTNNPPHLFTVAIVLPTIGRNDPNWDAMWSVLLSHKKIYEQHLNRQFKFYYLESNDADGEDYYKLISDANNYLISGVIFPFPPPVSLTEKLHACNLPIAAVTDETFREHVSTIWMDYNGLFDKSLDYLRDSGCKRVALLTNTRLPMKHIDHFFTSVEDRGLTTEDYLVQAIGIDKYSRPWVTRLVKLILHAPVDRPDGLIVANQNLFRYVMASLHEMKLIPEKDLKVVVHSSFPNHEWHQNIKLIGFDLCKTLQISINALDIIRKTGQITHDGLSEALFEEEIKQ